MDKLKVKIQSKSNRETGILPVAGNTKARNLLVLLLFVSGASALIYQTLWVKQLALVVGVDVYAVTTVVSAFFAGLALGGAFFGRHADLSTQPLKLYAVLELGIAVLGVGISLSFAHIAGAFVALQAATGPFAWILPFLLVGLPAFLMGGTLPVLVRAWKPGDASIGRASGMLYAANTAGAIVGALAVPFLLVPALGMFGAAMLAGVLNLGLAGFALAMGRSQTSPITSISKRQPLARDAQLVLTLYAVAGGVALGYEVLWTQVIVQFLSTRAYAFAVVLATYLAGLMLGSAIYSRFADRNRQPWIVFGLLIAGAGASALAIFAALDMWLPNAQKSFGSFIFDLTGSKMLMMYARFQVAAAVMILLPTTLLGAAFPAAMRLVGGAQNIGRNIGAVAAFNTAGGIAGTFLTGFVLLPWLGLVRSLGILAFIGAVLGGIAIVHGAKRRNAPSLVWATVLIVCVGLTAAFIPTDKFARLLSEVKGGSLVFYDESPGGTVAVVEQTTPGLDGTFRRLYIQGVSNSGDVMASRRYMRLQALLPVLIHNQEPRSALVVGLGTGITTGALLTYPLLERRVCVELVPSVVRAAKHFDGNFDVTTDPRITLKIGDGRHELLQNSERYDIITLEPPPPSAAGVVNLYSSDFYELCRDRLEPNGLMAQWWPLQTQNDEDSRSLVRSMLDVFPYVTLWSTELYEMLVIGSMEPIELDIQRISERFRLPNVASALADVGITSPSDLLATYVTDRTELEKYVGNAKPVTDDRPLIEYSAWVRTGEFPRVLAKMMTLCSDIPLRGDNEVKQRVETEREKLWAFYRLAYYAYTGEKRQWVQLRAQLDNEIDDNIYYRYFVGG